MNRRKLTRSRGTGWRQLVRHSRSVAEAFAASAIAGKHGVSTFTSAAGAGRGLTPTDQRSKATPKYGRRRQGSATTPLAWTLSCYRKLCRLHALQVQNRGLPPLEETSTFAQSRVEILTTFILIIIITTRISPLSTCLVHWYLVHCYLKPVPRSLGPIHSRLQLLPEWNNLETFSVYPAIHGARVSRRHSGHSLSWPSRRSSQPSSWRRELCIWLTSMTLALP